VSVQSLFEHLVDLVDHVLEHTKYLIQCSNQAQRSSFDGTSLHWHPCCVGELVPTKAVYAVYDSNTANLRFVHGDGQIIVPEQVCMMQTFKDNQPNFNRSQRLHLIELDRPICEPLSVA